jgi:protein FAM32A
MFLPFSKIERRAGADGMFKQLQDRLQKEGVKTHKQRVEELNKYLSNLSEHHDMPRIGPG